MTTSGEHATRGACGDVLLATKTCTKCRERKPLTEFYRNQASKDGHHSWCKACHRSSTDAAQAIQRRLDPEGFRRSKREAVQRHRAKHGMARNRDIVAAREEAIRLLIAAHRPEFDRLYYVAKYERDLLS